MKTITAKKLILGALVWLAPAIALAQQWQGYDVLGLAMYCDKYLAAPKLPAVSTLMNTFGNPLPCIEKRIQQGGLEVVQVDLIDATCWRNRVCPPGAPRPDDLGTLKSRAAKVSALAEKYPSVKFWLSPGLEHDVKDAGTVKKMFAVIKKGCPKCQLINSPFTGARISGIPLELHGTKSRAFSISSDGASQFDGDNMSSDCVGEDREKGRCRPFEHRTSGSYSTFGWIPEFNLRCSGEKSFTQPLKRTEKPSGDLFRQSFLLMQPEQPKPGTPPQCKTVRDITPGREITKTNAEHYCNGQKKDARGNKPLLIVQIPGHKGDKMPILRPDGKQVAAACYWDTYSPMRNAHRWYVGGCTGETPVELMDELGTEWAHALYAPGKCLRFNAIRRQGVYK